MKLNPRVLLIKILALFIFFFSVCSFAENNLIKPHKLSKGDTIALISPSYKVSEEQKSDAISRVEALGFKVYIPKSLDDVDGCYAGNPQARADEINNAFNNKDIKGIFAIKGGAGSAHLLDKIDYNLIKENPKVFVGYSDITALLNAITYETGLVTFHGPMPAFPITKFSADYLKKVAMYAGKTSFKNNIETNDDLINTKNKTITINGGSATGRIYGGNLTVLANMIGSKHFPSANDWKGKILFIEDIDEQVYRIDRTLAQLKNAGILSQISGFVFGGCTNCEVGCKGSVDLIKTLRNYFAKLNIPVFQGAMIGHIDKTYTIPIGVLVKIDADNGTIEMLEEAVADII